MHTHRDKSKFICLHTNSLTNLQTDTNAHKHTQKETNIHTAIHTHTKRERERAWMKKIERRRKRERFTPVKPDIHICTNTVDNRNREIYENEKPTYLSTVTQTQTQIDRLKKSNINTKNRYW